MSTSGSATTAKSKTFMPSEKKPAAPRPSSFSSVSARKIQVKALLTESSAARRSCDIPAPLGGGSGIHQLAGDGPQAPGAKQESAALLYSMPTCCGHGQQDGVGDDQQHEERA